jgi:hypothetical protein
MRTLKESGLIHDVDYAEFPEGTIQNETDFVEGTPVVEEVYGDIIVNLYKLLISTGVVPDQTQDNETKGVFQIIDALKRFANDYNDIEQVLSVNSNVWSIGLDIAHLPDKYACIAKASENYVYSNLIEFLFKGSTNSPSYAVECLTGFKAGDEVLIIINKAKVELINLTPGSPGAQNSPIVYTGLGAPLAFDETNVVKYEIEGKLVYNENNVVDLIEAIKTKSGDPNAVIYDTVLVNGYILCFCFIPTIGMRFYQFDSTNIGAAESINADQVFDETHSPFMFADVDSIYITNEGGFNVLDNKISRYVYDPGAATLTFATLYTLDLNYVKTSNTIIRDRKFYSFIASTLKEYDLVLGGENILGNFKINDGVIFNFNSFAYYTNGEVAQQWII